MSRLLSINCKWQDGDPWLQYGDEGSGKEQMEVEVEVEVEEEKEGATFLGAHASSLREKASEGAFSDMRSFTEG
ncbi:unnamed protein product [Hydatigera taeniaeformis]|uniref:Uncharacterized protein n=1 Tax=Hydatigena taeniaeformis TaxID=6205 RepID=A0A0R3WYK6_HYDTA|nr:unnamed protein product [Hydatigera taeniaeformis]